jgi:hypothetical protein
MSRPEPCPLFRDVNTRTKEQNKERIDFVARHVTSPAWVAAQLKLLSQRNDAEGALLQLSQLREASTEVGIALDLFDEKASVDRAEGFLADLAEDRSSAPAEIVPVIDQYISRLREVIARAWERQIPRRELDAHVLQLHLAYSRDLDRILQGLILNTAP